MTHSAATPPTAEQVEEIRKLAEKVFRDNPLPWETDTEKNDGDFGIGDETESGYLGYAMFDANGKRLFGSENSDCGCVKVEDDEDGSHAWDMIAEQNFTLIAKLMSHLPALIAAPAPAERAEAVPNPVIAAFAAAIDVADRLIERAYGMDKPQDWEDVFNQVVKARSDAGRAKRKTKAAPTRAGALDAAGEDAYPDLTEAEWTKLVDLVPEKRRRIISSIALLIRAALAAGDGGLG